MIAKPISIKDAKRKFGGCAQKAVELISGDLLHVSDSGLRVKQFLLILQQKSAAGVVLTRVRKAQTVSASSRTLDSRVALRQPISLG
jgi:hypothetical protein